MFDIGFSEMLVIGVVALVVIGPDRLPKVARTAGHLIGRMQRYVSDVKADINREVEMSELKDIKKTMEDAAATMNSAMASHADELTQGVRHAEQEFEQLKNPMMHFGQGGALAEAPGSDGGSPHVSLLEGDISPQLELGLVEERTGPHLDAEPTTSHRA